MTTVTIDLTPAGESRPTRDEVDACLAQTSEIVAAVAELLYDYQVHTYALVGTSLELFVSPLVAIRDLPADIAAVFEDARVTLGGVEFLLTAEVE